MKVVEREQGFTFGLAETEADRLAVYRLRYEVYVEEMQRQQPAADHARRLVREPCDERSTLLMARDGDRLAGTSRITRHQDYPCPLADYYGIDRLTRHTTAGISEGTKLMIRPRHRRSRSPLGRLMVLFGYRVLRDLNIAFDFLNANPYLVDHYRAFGYRTCGPPFRHPELLDEVVPMVLVTEDAAYLERVGSPLADVAARYPRRTDTADLAARVLDLGRTGDGTGGAVDECGRNGPER